MEVSLAIYYKKLCNLDFKLTINYTFTQAYSDQYTKYIPMTMELPQKPFVVPQKESEISPLYPVMKVYNDVT